MTFFTTTLTSGSLTINKEDGVSLISIVTDSTSGSCTVLGGGTFQGMSSTPTPLSMGQGANFVSTNPQYSLSQLTITWIAGSIEIIIGY
jgi:hypothetical protein